MRKPPLDLFRFILVPFLVSISLSISNWYALHLVMKFFRFLSHLKPYLKHVKFESPTNLSWRVLDRFLINLINHLCKTFQEVIILLVSSNEISVRFCDLFNGIKIS